MWPAREKSNPRRMEAIRMIRHLTDTPSLAVGLTIFSYTKSPATCSGDAAPRKLPGKCASLHPKPTPLGTNTPYRDPRISGLFRDKALLAYVAGPLVVSAVHDSYIKPRSATRKLCVHYTRWTSAQEFLYLRVPSQASHLR